MTAQAQGARRECVGIVISSLAPGASPTSIQISGTLEVRDDNWNTVGKVPMLVSESVEVFRNRSKFKRLKVKAGPTVAHLPVVKGKVVPQTRTHGWVGADGTVVIEG